MGDPLRDFGQVLDQKLIPPDPVVPTTPRQLVSMDPTAPAAPVDPEAARRAAVAGTLARRSRGELASPEDASIMQGIQVLPPQSGQLSSAGKTITTGGSSTRLSADAKKAAKLATGEGYAAADLQESAADTVARQAREEAAVVEQEAKAQLDRAAQYQEAQAQADAEVSKRMKAFEDARKEITRATEELDPNRVMKGGRGILASIAMGLGAYGAGLTGSKNFAMEIINGAIERDFEAQKAKVDTAKYNATMAGQAYDMVRGQFRDSLSQKLAYGAMMKDAFATKMDAMAKAHAGTQRGEALKVSAQQARAAYAKDLAELLGRETTTTQRSVANHLVANQPKGPSELLSLEVEKQKKLDELNKHAMPRESDNTLKSKSVEFVQAAGTTMQLAMNLRDQLRNAIASGVAPTMLSKDAGIRKAALALAQEPLMRERTGAVIGNEEAIRENMKMIGQGNWTGSADTQLQYLDQYLSAVAAETKNKINLLHPVDREDLWNRAEYAFGDTPVWADLSKGRRVNSSEKAAAAGVQLRNPQ